MGRGEVMKETAAPDLLAECEMWRKKAELWKEERSELNNECHRHNKLRLDLLAHAERLAEAASKMIAYIDRNWPGKRSERLPVQELREALAAWEGAKQ
jgi:hypothetical protein